MDETKKREIYDGILEELRYHFSKTKDPTARMSTVVALLHHRLKRFFWTGFYLLIDGELTVGAYQGPPACITLPVHRGVCWAGIDRAAPINVPNVHDFPDHIVCDGRANSELVVPLRDPNGTILGVLDIDSADFDAFDDVDIEKVEQILRALFAIPLSTGRPSVPPAR